MAKRSEFKPDTELRPYSRPLQIPKAYSTNRFPKKTVLTDDVFTYVSFYYSSHPKAMKFLAPKNRKEHGNPKQYGYEFYWNQAKVFYDSAKALPIESSPVAAYYCMLNAAKSYLAYSMKSADGFIGDFSKHGIIDGGDKGEDLSTICVGHKKHGVFFRFATELDEDFLNKWNERQNISLKRLLYNLPFVHRAFSMTYTTKSHKIKEIFIPLASGNCPTYYKWNGRAYLYAKLDEKYFQVNAVSIPDRCLPNAFTQCSETKFGFNSVNGARCNPRSISFELKELNNNLRKHFAYIKSDDRLWYLKHSDVDDEEMLNLSTMTLNMAVMHRMSEIARYKPEQLTRLMKSKENWLLHEYLTLALDQFIDELAAQITKQDIMCTGYKPGSNC